MDTPRSGVDGRPDLLTRDNGDDGAWGVQAEEDHRQRIVARHADRGGVGDLEVPGQILVVAEMVELDRLGMGLRIGVVDAVHPLLAHQQHLGAEFNIQCNGIGPGYIATPQTAPLREPQEDGSRHPFDQFLIAKTPAARWGDAEDLAGPSVFLASGASDFVNGHVLYVDGGILAYIGKQP